MGPPPQPKEKREADQQTEYAEPGIADRWDDLLHGTRKKSKSAPAHHSSFHR